MDVGCIVLAGGKGMRLGHDKVVETLGSKSLLQRVIARLAPICKEITIVTASAREIPIDDVAYRVVTDVLPGKGPLGGIYSGLRASGSPYSLVVACDMPFLNEALLRHMIGVAPGFDVVAPRVGKLVEPLHAVYSRSCLPVIEEMLSAGRMGVHELLGLVKVRYVEEEEIDRFDPQHLSFFNINTKADMEKARELAGSGK